MSKTFKSLVICWVLFCANIAQAQMVCADAVCRDHVDGKGLVSAPCASEMLSVIFSQSNGAMIIQCDASSASPEESLLLLYDRLESTRSAYEFTDARVLTPGAEEWAALQTEGVPDKFGPKPLCNANDKRPPAGAFFIAVKTPKQGEDPEPPYCYDLYLVSGDSGNWLLSTPFGKQQPQSLTAKDLARWKTLQENVMSSSDIQKQAAATGNELVAIVSDKASLFSSPELSRITKMYLIKGDRIEILDSSRRAVGWVKIRYTTKSGKVFDNWIQANSLEAR